MAANQNALAKKQKKARAGIPSRKPAQLKMKLKMKLKMINENENDK